MPKTQTGLGGFCRREYAPLQVLHSQYDFRQPVNLRAAAVRWTCQSVMELRIMPEDNRESKAQKTMIRSLIFGIGFVLLLFWLCVPPLFETRFESGGTLNNLKQIGLTLQNYHEFYDQYPPSFSTDKNGKPLLSWRVLILPQLEQENVYKQFRLDEAWDSPHNLSLLPKMPRLYHPRNQKPTDPFVTNYQVFVGPGSMFEAPGHNIQDARDGTSSTLMVVDAAEEVPWTKPVDLPYAPDKPIPALGGHFTRVRTLLWWEYDRQPGFLALFVDGSVIFLKNEIDEPTMRGLITRAGGEHVDLSPFQILPKPSRR